MIDHVSVSVSDVERAKAFFRAALEPLGYVLAMEGDGYAGFADARRIPDFWLSAGGGGATTHVALQAPDRATVDRFHAAGTEAGGSDNGAPGLRPHYHEHYYAAYVHDPDGNNIEAVCHQPE